MQHGVVFQFDEIMQALVIELLKPKTPKPRER